MILDIVKYIINALFCNHYYELITEEDSYKNSSGNYRVVAWYHVYVCKKCRHKVVDEYEGTF